MNYELTPLRRNSITHGSMEFQYLSFWRVVLEYTHAQFMKYHKKNPQIPFMKIQN